MHAFTWPQSLFTSATIGLIFMLGACESKSVEESPQTTEVSGLNLEDRLTLKKSIDERMASVNETLSIVRHLSRKFEDRVQKEHGTSEPSSLLDFLSEMNEGLNERLPSASNEKRQIERTRTITLPSWSTEPQCQELDLRVNVDLSEDNTVASIVYSIKSCETNGQFIEFAQAAFIDSRYELTYDSSKLRDSVVNPIVEKFKKQFQCTSKVEDSIVLEVECKNINVSATKGILIHIESAQYLKRSNERIKAHANIFEDEILKAQAFLSVLNTGKVKFKLNRVETERSEESSSLLQSEGAQK